MTRSRKQRNKVPTNAQVSADESTRIHINQVLRDFCDSAEDVYTFEADLTNAERASVHVLCRKMGLASKSSGNGNQRCVSVYKNKSQNTSENDKKQKLNMEEEKLSYLGFSEETQGVLRDLFIRYPPNEEQTEVLNANCKQEYDKRGRKKDDSFCKPSMTQIEIAAKMESFASRLNKSPKFNQIVKDRVKLPIAAFKDTITSTVESHQVVLISGETGCGKTTQVPQFLLDDMWGKGQACKIICTQPRRISAISVAERISYERGEPVGDNIGYKIRMKTKGGKHSSVMFCTNGVLLRVLVGKGTSKLNARAKDISSKDDNLETTHIIVDEIHERDRFSDFMLAILRDMLPSYPNLRLILMSATLDAERFSQYFGGCPIIRVPGFTFPVRTFYLEDVLSILKSTDCNHLDSASLSDTAENGQSTEDDMAALDEAIDLAWSSDEFVPLLELITCESTLKACNYQHSLTRISPLMVFAGKGRVGDVCMLLSLGADCHLRADDGKTALDCAQQENHEEVVQILKDHLDNSLSKSAAKEELLQTYLASINPEHIDIILIERLVRKICIDSKEGAILVFLPGWDDINKTRERLHASPFFGDTRKFVIQPLHSMVPAFEQKKVFGHPPPGSRKIILSTNIAETAVTIDDVVYVIDSGRMKEKSYDPYNNVSTLHSSWISKASARQREGRAGRCLPGICYHLYSRTRATSLPEFQIPEIKRMPIEELCLQVKMLDPNCKIEDFLQKTLDPPVFETIRNAIAVLRDIGALTVDESLTELGEKLGSLPVHPSVSKMLFFAILMNCLDPALTLACASDYRDPFILPVAPTERQQALSAKTEFASLYGGHSDQLMVIAAFECWKRAKDNGQEARFCARYFVSAATMRMLSSMRMQLRRELIRNGFIQEDDSCSQNAQDPAILHAVLVAGLYPMVGKLLPPHKYGQRPVVETASGAKVRLHPHSSNFKLSLKKSKCPSLVVYDEITRGDGGMYIRNCTVVGPYPLLFLATDLVVAPSKGNDDEESDEEDYASGSDEDGMEIHVPSSKQPGERIMSSPDNTVSVIIDHWLTFQSTALDVAQIYCLRERLSAAILFKVKHPTKVLPPDLGASIYAIACVLSYDGLSGILPSMKPVNLSTSMANTAESNSSTAGEEGNQNISKFLMSLMSNKDMWQNQYRRPMTVSNVIRGSNRLDSNMSPSCASHNTPSQGPASGGNGSGRNPKRHFSKRRCGAPH